MNMVEEKGYNGWSNYETWAVALWIDNERPAAERWHERAEDLVAENIRDASMEPSAQRDTPTIVLAEELKEEIEDEADILLEEANKSASLYADLLHSSLHDVDWYEIADKYTEEARAERERG